MGTFRNDELLGAYRKELENCGLDADDMKAALRVSTSDVGTSGANLYPMLLCGLRQNTIALGDPLRLSHENGATLEQFDKQLGLLFGKYQAALKNLTRLLGILITNPGNCMIGIMKR